MSFDHILNETGLTMWQGRVDVAPAKDQADLLASRRSFRIWVEPQWGFVGYMEVDWEEEICFL